MIRTARPQPAKEDDIARFFGVVFPKQWTAKAIKRGKLVDAVGGFFEGEGGQWFGFLDIPSRHKSPMLYRHAKHVLNEAFAMGATTIRTTCDEDIPRAREFMLKLGFEPTEETINDEKVWECRALK